MNIFEYSDYRKFLKDSFELLKASEGLSFRGFSQRAQFSSPNFLQLVMQSKRNLSIEGSRQVARGLNLGVKQSEYFEVLVLENQSRDILKKKELTEKLIYLKQRESKKDNLTDYEYYRNWYNIPVREALVVNGSAKAEDIARAFWPKLSAKEVRQAIQLLVKLNLVKRKKGGGYAITTEETLRTKDNLMNSLMIQFHGKMLELAKESIMSIPSPERDLTALTIGLSKESFSEIKELVKEFKIKVMEMAEKDKDKSDVYQVGLQIFPITRGVK